MIDDSSAAAHARLKESIFQCGLIDCPVARPPVTPPSSTEQAEIRAGLAESGVAPRFALKA